MDEIAERYADVETCECGDPVECLDGGGYSYWVHVKRMNVEYDHAAVPVRPGYREAANYDGLIMQHECGNVRAFDRPPPTGAWTCGRCRGTQLWLRGEVQR